MMLAIFQAGVRDGWRLPEFLTMALERDRRLVEGWPAGTEDFTAVPLPEPARRPTT